MFLKDHAMVAHCSTVFLQYHRHRSVHPLIWIWSMTAEAPKGYKAVLDNIDGYSFYYPFGWQVAPNTGFLFPDG